MAPSPYKFAQLLTDAIHRIKIQERKTIALVQDELGYELGRKGGSSVEYWRKGHIPAKVSDVEGLSAFLVRRGGLSSVTQLEELLRSAGYVQLVLPLSDALFPQKPSTPPPELAVGTRVRHESPPANKLAPFVVGVPIIYPRQFFGRHYELKRIFGLLKRFPLQNVAILGPRCSGKTSLLRYLEQITTTPPSQLRPHQRHNWLPQQNTYRWVFVDFRDVRMQTRQGLMHHILNTLELPVSSTLTLEHFLDLLSDHLHTPAVILMDNIGAGLASEELDQPFWWSLRSLSGIQSHGNLAFILTSHILPSQLAQDHGKPSPFFNMFGHTLKLGALTTAEAEEMIASSPRPFSAEDREWIINESRSCPCLLQLLCDTRLTALEYGEMGEDWKAEGLARIARFAYLLEGS